MKGDNALNIKFNKESIFVFYVAVVMATYMLPSLKISVPYLYAALLMLVFFPIAVLKMKMDMYYLLLIVAAFLISVLYFINGIYGPTDSINEAIRSIRFFMPVLWTVYALRYCSEKQRRHLLIVFGIIMTYILVKTFIALQEDMWITRVLAQNKTSDNDDIRAYRLDNVGGFEFSYTIGVVVLCLFWAVINSKTLIAKIICLAGAFVGFYYIIQTMYMTLLLLTTIGILLLLLFNIKNIFIKITLVLIGIIFILFIADIFYFLSELFTGSLLSTKFLKFYEATIGEGIDSLGSRPGMMREAIEQWVQSPIWGNNVVVLNTHSLFFAVLESTGLIGVVALILCFIKSFKLISSEIKSDEYDTRLLFVVFLYVVALLILNPIGYVFEITIAAFFITPLWAQVINNRSEKEGISLGIK